MKKTLFLIFLTTLFSQGKYYNNSSFKQLDDLLPTPNEYRNATGAPGPKYWKQKVDYKMNIVLDEDKLTITGDETVRYYNNSPMSLSYIWFQLEQNMRKKNSIAKRMSTASSIPANSDYSITEFKSYLKAKNFDGGYTISSVTNSSGKKLTYTIVGTMMRIDLPKKLKSNDDFIIKIKWSYPLNDMTVEGRSGYELFKDGNYVFSIAQFFPRAAVFDDTKAWQTQPFLGRGEFALEFGDYDVSITVPSDHIVSGTGVLQNESDVLTKSQRARLKRQKTADDVKFIVTPEEALEKEKSKSKKKKTWHFKAKNVRDFAFASSRKFVWDASSVKSGNKRVLAMSLYPKEGMPLYDKYSTHLVKHTIETYNKYTFDYPYPVAISIHSADEVGGMEYPMICFNGGRPEADGTYSESVKEFVILVIIHEVGHNYFPMIVSSDERQWTWMDEGLNSFLQYIAEREWDPNFNSAAGPAELIVDYMASDNVVPIMTNSEAILQFGNNAYNKPSAGLNILRETIMGRELFDFAFKRYANLWKYKHPNPSDFFRVMEDASGIDLDWFFRNWFYTTKYVNQSIDNVEVFVLNDGNPVNQKQEKKERHITDIRNDIKDGGYEGRNNIKDFYSSYDPYKYTDDDKELYELFMETLDESEKELYKNKSYFYKLSFSNVDDRSMVMPVILEINYEDNSKEIIRIPVQVWMKNEKRFSKDLIRLKKIKSIVLDPLKEIPDIDRSDNTFPRQIIESEFNLYKKYMNSFDNPMRDNVDDDN